MSTTKLDFLHNKDVCHFYEARLGREDVDSGPIGHELFSSHAFNFSSKFTYKFSAMSFFLQR